MQVKFNKEMFLKHRFWIMIGVAMFLILASMFYLQFAVDADQEITKLKSSQIKGKYQAAYNQKTTAAEEAHAKTAAEQETKIWKEAFDKQKLEFKWADAVEKFYFFYDGFFATDVKLDKAPGNVNEWPKDSAHVVHGTLFDYSIDSFEISTRDGKKKKLMRTPQIDNVAVVGQPERIVFARLKDHIGKLAAVSYQEGRYFGDPLTAKEQNAFINSYEDQILKIIGSIDPLSEKNTGVVQLKDWLFRAEALPRKVGTTTLLEVPFFRHVTKPWDGNKDNSKEIWIAQENLWIQREIYRLIADSNETVSKFKLKEPEKDSKFHTFENAYFQVKLSLHKDGALTFVIKNRTARQQRLDVDFRIKLNKDSYETKRISAKPLMPAGDKADTYTEEIPAPADSLRKEILGLEQVLTWETAAVKRVDLISIGSLMDKEISHSHRTFPEGLKPLDEKDQPKDGKLKGVGDDPKPMDPIRGGGPGAGALGPNKKLLEHELWTERYLELPDQTRRVPVMISLIVDQDHVDRVLTQFNNSKLRFLLTQVLMNQYTGSLAPPLPDALDPPKGGVVPKQPIGPARPPSYPMYPGGMPPQFMGGVGPGVGGAGGAGGGETNMELVMYGVMTLYQRYPPRPALPPTDKK